MNTSHGKNEREALRSQVTFLRTVVLALIALLCLMAGGWGWTVINERSILVPPEVRRPYEIGAGYGSKDYLADMSTYVLSMMFTISPETVEWQNKVILKMTHPDGYGRLKADLEANGLRLKRDRIATVWIPRTEKVSERSKTVVVSGKLKTYIADVLTSEKDKEYQIEFDITSSGRLYVVRVQEVAKPEPAGRSPE
jgi:conjugal transfer pilus assembly protein TraE